MWGEFCNHYPLNGPKDKIEIPKDIVDKGTIKEYKFFNYIIKIIKNK